jgi:hypothetical protein
VRDGVTQLNSGKYAAFRLENPTIQPDAWIFTRWDYDAGRMAAAPKFLDLEGFKLTIVQEIMRNRNFHTTTSEYRRAINTAHTPRYVPGMTIPTIAVDESTIKSIISSPNTLLVSQAGEPEGTSGEDNTSQSSYRRYAFGSIDVPADVANATEAISELTSDDDDASPGFTFSDPKFEVSMPLFPRKRDFMTEMTVEMLKSYTIQFWSDIGKTPDQDAYLTKILDRYLTAGSDGRGAYIGPTVPWKGWETASPDAKCYALYHHSLPNHIEFSTKTKTKKNSF